MPEFELPHDHGTGSREIAALSIKLAEDDCFQTVSDVFKQLSDPTRTRIFWLLCHCEECVMNISAIVGMSSPAVSHHLKALKASGLVCSRREGKEVYYRVPDTETCRLLHNMIEETLAVTCPESSLPHA